MEFGYPEHSSPSFLQIPIYKLQNQTIAIENRDADFFPNLEDRILEARTFEGRVATVERYFSSLLQHQLISADHQRIAHVVGLIKETKGNISIDTLASHACLSRKQFERKFSAFVGISPKQFLKIVRFQNAIFLAHDATELNLTDLAYDSGYYDQSHFINETKELTGQTPKKLFTKQKIVSDYFG